MSTTSKQLEVHNSRLDEHKNKLEQPLGPATQSRVTAVDRWLVRRLFRATGYPSISIRLWNDECMTDSSGGSVGCVHIKDRWTLFKVLFSRSLGFGEAYMDGHVEVKGSLTHLCEELNRCWVEHSRIRHVRSNNVIRSKENVHHHYDLGNEFYGLWLDPQMVYTCAYYREPAMTLAEAQVEKLDLVCRKLRLRPGQSVVEAGCGWGALALHMASKYGVTVTACNVSSEQLKYARYQACERGLSHQVKFIEEDWRNLTGHYDAFVSVGMLEHVGIANYRALGNTIDRLLNKQGLGLIHTIGRNAPKPMDPWLNRYIFPGAIVPDLAQIMDIFHPDEFSVLDVENLRLHYARTLEDWSANFERHIDDVRTMFDERFVRMWRLYLSGSIAGFRTGHLQLFQILFARHDNNEVPWTRDDLFSWSLLK